ncbi:MAG: tRNA lysidine(34) synthetase TilS [Cyclobacteriaceae bacterium]|nr:tRNA lysidine(34) synthetase TilS [Cyclobacteriaceae bacterium]
MHRRLSDYIDHYQLFTREEPVLLAVSGGVDSIVLTHLMHKANYNFSIAHCNFKLRGDASEGDELFVRNLAQHLDKKIYVKEFQTSEYAATHGISIQMAARELRRQWFDSLVHSDGFVRIVTAHHINDSLETALYNITRGTGVAGLTGMPPTNGIYARPLMFASRQIILEYARTNELEWREDASNATTKYHRNLIRHQVIPVLKQINPALEFSFQSTAERVTAAASIYRSVIEKYRMELLTADGTGYRLSVSALKNVNEPRQVIYELLLPFGFNYSQAADILSSFDRQSGKRFFSMEYSLTIDRDFAFLMPLESATEIMMSVNIHDPELSFLDQDFYFENGPRDNYEITADPESALLDMDQLTFPLTVRRWKEGDWFRPLGMRNKKKVSDFMIDLKIPLTLKERIVVFISGEDIVWVAGHRIDDRYKITSKTRKIFRISKQQTDV